MSLGLCGVMAPIFSKAGSMQLPISVHATKTQAFLTDLIAVSSS
jgi:hypothetical protein